MAQTFGLKRSLVMARTPKDVTGAELEVLRLLWELGPATIRQLSDRLPAGPAAKYATEQSKYATVQKLLERLERDGYVARERTAGAHTFTAVVSRDELIGRRLRSVAETLCDGSVTPLLTHLVRAQGLSERDRRELR